MTTCIGYTDHCGTGYTQYSEICHLHWHPVCSLLTVWLGTAWLFSLKGTPVHWYMHIYTLNEAKTFIANNYLIATKNIKYNWHYSSYGRMYHSPLQSIIHSTLMASSQITHYVEHTLSSTQSQIIFLCAFVNFMGAIVPTAPLVPPPVIIIMIVLFTIMIVVGHEIWIDLCSLQSIANSWKCWDR